MTVPGVGGPGQAECTDGPKSERRLARLLGYPRSWHVVRVVPHPANDDGPGGGRFPFASFQDRIYAGDPRSGADVYYNHGAGYDAALRWVEGESTAHGDGGGQMAPRVAKFGKGDRVEVYYEDDETWYGATIERVKKFEDDIRYTVHYTEEDTTQPNVSEEDIRPAPPPPKPKRGRKRKKQDKAVPQAGKKKSKGVASFDAGTPPQVRDVDPELARNAKEMGFPEGWAVKRNKNYKLAIWGPDGKRYRAKRAAFKAAGLEMPPPPGSGGGGSSRKRGRGRPPKQSPPPDDSAATTTNSSATGGAKAEEEGDPPWRTAGHLHIGRRVTYAPPGGGPTQEGTVTGWIASTDKDSAGEPGFISERSGQPASLFHVTFDRPVGMDAFRVGWLESQDFEKYELEELFEAAGEDNARSIDGGDEGSGSGSGEENSSDGDREEDEDEIPLSAIAKKKKPTAAEKNNSESESSE